MAATIAAAAVAAALGRAVRLSTGSTVVGNTLPGADEFLGMKFADAERYEPPVDYTKAYPQEPFVADDFGRACMQVGDSVNETYGSEDCLYLNVWAPANATATSRLPVLVYIYGGSMQFGESEPYNGSAMAVRHNVVYASLAYRTGPIGWIPFASDVDAKKPTGNWGQLDQQSALRWVQREIENFGGDKTRVAIHGQSSGATCTALHVLMPGSAGLIRGLVGESGGLGEMRTAEEVATTTTAKIGEQIGCDPKALGVRTAAFKDCFRKVDPLQLTRLTYSFGLSPVVDGVVVPAQPAEFWKKGSRFRLNDISVMIGFNTNDTMKEIAPAYLNTTTGTLRPVSKAEYTKALKDAVPASLVERALALYPPLCDNCPENVNRIGSLSSDSSLCSARRTLSHIAALNRGKAYLYRFDWRYQSNPRCTAEPNYHPAYYGSMHEDEVTFVMGQPIFMFAGSCCGKWGAKLRREPCPQLPSCVSCFDESLGDGYHAYFNEKEWAFSATVGGFWARFAASGDPNPQGEGRVWPALHERAAGSGLGHNIVLNADLPGGHAVEATIYDNPDICSFWDAVAAAKQ